MFFTIVLTVTVVIVSLALGLGISLLLNRSFFGRGIVRTFMITPFLIVPVAAALLWKHAIYNPVYGLLNGLLTWFGWPSAGLDHRLPAVGDRGSADLVLDPVHDPDPAGRAAVPPR